jgi:hypothetical protein
MQAESLFNQKVIPRQRRASRKITPQVCSEAAFAPPLETATRAGRSTRSPIM